MSVPAPRGRLERFLRPRSVAVVGASERQARSNNAVGAMRDGGMELLFVNPNRSTVYDAPAYRDLVSIRRPVDAVLSLVGAEAAVDVVADARAANCGGVVVIAGGFAETGPAGVALERRLADAAGAMPLLGPNCNGFIRPAIGAQLSGAPRLAMPAGTIGVVTHSGGLLGAFGLAAYERGIGFTSLISTGNELALDMADCIEFLVEDEETVVIALVIETIRGDPRRFFAAVERAADAGKPVIALKLGRSTRGREIAASHTGALTGEAWVYEAAFRQHRMIPAADLVDLLDRASLLAQLPRERWSAVEGLAVVSLSGGWSAMASDVCAEEGVPLPALSDLSEAVNALIPDRVTINPLDMTGFAMGRSDVVRGLLDILGGDRNVDALMVQWFVDEASQESGAAIIEAAVDAAGALELPVLLGSIEDGHLGAWARELPGRGVAVGRGLRATARGLATMGEFVRRGRSGPRPDVAEVAALARPSGELLTAAGERMLTFEAAMGLLTSAGIPAAPHIAIDAGSDPHQVHPPFAAPYVVKIADVAHRSDIGGVRLGVQGSELPAALSELRAIAREHGESERVVIQPQVQIDGEAFIGVQTDGGLGPIVVFGVGGVFVELLGRVAGRLAPLVPGDARDMLEEIADTGVFDRRRGTRAWDRAQLERLLLAAGALAVGAAAWMESLDVNPLALTARGFVALDGLCLISSGAPPER